MEKFAVILVAAGKSRRFAGDQKNNTSSITQKKPFAPLDGQAVWLYSARCFYARKEVRQIIIAVAPEDRIEFQKMFAAEIVSLSIDIVEGGLERFDSVGNALAVIRDDIDYIAIHDAARPCITDELIENVFAAALKYGAAIPAAPLYGTIKRARPGLDKSQSEGTGSVKESHNTNTVIQQTVPRENLWEAQTPQVFQKKLYLRAWQQKGTLAPTDDSQLVENAGENVFLVPSDNMNLKITTSQDMIRAEKYLEILNGK